MAYEDPGWTRASKWLEGESIDPKVFEAHSAGLNIDLVWGAVMAAFGALMLVLAALHRRPTPPSADEG